MLVRFFPLLITMAFSVTLFGADPTLIGYWNFEESSGSTVLDQTANANHGTMINATRVLGALGNGIFLDTSGSEIDLGIPTNLSPHTAITLEAWYRPVPFVGTGNDPIIDRGGPAHDLPCPYQFHLGVQGNLRTHHPDSTGDFLFDLGINNDWFQIRKDAIWKPGDWYHVVGTWDGMYQKLYVNGVLVSSQVVGGSLPDIGNTMHFGGFSNLPYKLPGTLDEIRIYSRAINETEILQRAHEPLPEITQCPVSLKVPWFQVLQYDFDATDPEDAEISWSVFAHEPVVNPPTISPEGLLSFGFDESEEATVKTFTVVATNLRGLKDSCTFTVETIGIDPFVIRIEKTHGTVQGMYEYVSITWEQGVDQMGGFDFLISYDPSALQLVTAQLGQDLGPSGCGWEYFTYRHGPTGNCGGPCPSGMLRLVAIADANNGANHPDCYSIPLGGELAVLKFFVTIDRLFECQYVPIRFAWMDCGDNGISNVGGDTLWISSKVFDFENTDPLHDPNYEITDLDCYFAVALGGACSDCDVSEKYSPIRFIYYWNGGIDIVCSDSIDAPGDLNLNGLSYEIADAVLYTNYFIFGYSAFDPNPQYLQAQIAASDTNLDGSTLTVGDLVYLLRVIVGDALPFSKLTPFANVANVTLQDGSVSVQSPVDIGAVHLTFKVSGAFSITNNTPLELISSEKDGTLRVLLYSGLVDMRNRLSAGYNSLLMFEGNLELQSTEICDYDGNMLSTNVSTAELPSRFVLEQNVPNPFNPTTKIGLDLPAFDDWTLDIYNVSGQTVRTFQGKNSGRVIVEFDASDLPSGVYFYKATVGSHAATRKMLLLK